jgi:hypothetical protein
VVIQRFAKGRRAAVLIEPPKSRARGTETRSAARPSWTVSEIAQACAGLGDIEFRAALFAYAGDRSYYWPLWDALHAAALELRERHEWPPLILDIHEIEVPYLRHLSKLVLEEDANPQIFCTAPHLYPIFLNVTESVWKKILAERFGALQLVWLEWLGSAAARIQARLRGD